MHQHIKLDPMDKKMSIYRLINTIYEDFVFELADKDTIRRLQNRLIFEISNHYPLIENYDKFEISFTSNNNVDLSLNKELIDELEEKYPEALI